ncbi:MAG: hypothetical protein OHK0029_35300 [Armatimonadaceae bacterium]
MPTVEGAFASLHPRELTFALSEQQIADFRRDGYLLLPGLFTPEEAAEMQDEADALYAEASADSPLNLRYEISQRGDTGESVVWKIDPFVDISRKFRSVTRDRRIFDALASLYEGYEPRLFKDKLIYKPPHTHGNGLHQDYNWWQGFPHSLINVSIALDATDESQGCTELFPGYEQGLLTPEGEFHYVPKEKVDFSRGTKFLAQPGDVALFTAFTPHQAGPNTTDRFRRQIFLTYNDSRDGEFYHAHYEHFFWYRTKDLSEDRRKQMFFR